ncbi:TPA: morphogenetic protein [Yersinia enterocolitica]
MNEKPILFNAEMVNAILSGRKTQTRRIIKLPLIDKNMGCELAGNELAGEVNAGDYRNFPLGKPGDQLWVRECFSDLEDFDFFNPSVPDVISGYWYWADGNPEWGNWTKPKPSIHMPRRASRINLLITGVRVERLNDISDADASAEGCKISSMQSGECLSDVFSRLWKSIYGDESWQANPWVWVIEFERMEAK